MWLLLDINISKTERANIYFYRDFGRKPRQNKTNKKRTTWIFTCLAAPSQKKKKKRWKLTSIQMKFDPPLNARILEHFVSARNRSHMERELLWFSHRACCSQKTTQWCHSRRMRISLTTGSLALLLGYSCPPASDYFIRERTCQKMKHHGWSVCM